MSYVLDLNNNLNNINLRNWQLIFLILICDEGTHRSIECSNVIRSQYFNERLYQFTDPCAEDFIPLNDTVQDIHNLTAARRSTMINQCHLDYNNSKDTSKYWYRAKKDPNCERIASNSSIVKGESVSSSLLMR